MNKQTIRLEMIDAMKSKDHFKMNLLKVFISELDYIGKDPTEREIQDTAKKMIKSAVFIGTDEAKEEIKILETYLPKMLNDDQIKSIVKTQVDENPGMQKGPLTGKCMKACEGKGDFKIVSKYLDIFLNS